jgi:predicted phage-related endonuclease
MTHASKSHDAFARLEEIQDMLNEHARKTDELRTKLEQAQRDADLALLLADLASVMREVDTRNFSEGKRVRFNAVRQRLDAARAA